MKLNNPGIKKKCKEKAGKNHYGPSRWQEKLRIYKYGQRRVENKSESKNQKATMVTYLRM